MTTIAASRPAAAPSRSPASLRVVAAVQGLFYAATGVWSLAGIDSFQAVTGAKTDLWLVYTVGVLVIVVGATLLLAARSARVTPEVAVLGVGSAAALAGIDGIFVARGVISQIYLLDAAAEVVLILWWAIGASGNRSSEPV